MFAPSGMFGGSSRTLDQTFTTKQNDLALSDDIKIIRWNGAGSTGITGIEAPAGTAQTVTIVNASTDYLLWLENQNTASAAANRIILPDGLPAFLMPGDTITLYYDGTTARWRVLDWPTSGRGMGLTEVEDFIGGTAGVYASTTNSGTVSAGFTGSGATPGVAGVDTSTSASSRPTIGGSVSMSIGSGSWLNVARVTCNTALPTGAETFEGITGFSNVGSTTHTNAIAWNLRWNGSAAEWSQDCIDNGVATRATTNSPSPSLGAYVWFGVFVNAGATRADFFYSSDGIAFTLASSAASGLPTSARTLSPVAVAAMKTAGTTARTMRVDIAGYRAAYTSARA